MMARKNTLIAMMALLSCGVGIVNAQDDFDDIYYNPKKTALEDVKERASKVVATRNAQSNYISNMADMDVDAYNRRGEQYYVSDIDTIGSRAENGEDFIYTQQIQKYYNPTIVVENANALGDVLTNAYGNVDIIINDNGYPVFGPYYGWNWPYYSTWWSPSWYWNWNFGGWGWSIGWYNPWYSWAWGPGWNPGPPWRPGWGGPAWGPGPGLPPRPMATWSQGGNRPMGGGVRPATPPRPMTSTGRPGQSMSIPSKGSSGVRNPVRQPANTSPTNTGGVRPSGVVNNGGRWSYNQTPAGSQTQGNRVNGNVGNRPGVSNQPAVNNSGTQKGTSPSRVTTGRTTTTTQKSVSNSRTNTTTNRSTVSRSTGNRSTGGGSTGGGSRGSGGGGGGRRR